MNSSSTLCRIAFVAPIISYGASDIFVLRYWMLVHSSWLDAIHNHCPEVWCKVMTDLGAMNMARLGYMHILRCAFSRTDIDYSRAIISAIKNKQHAIVAPLIREKLPDTLHRQCKIQKIEPKDFKWDNCELGLYLTSGSLNMYFSDVIFQIKTSGDMNAIRALQDIGYKFVDYTAFNVVCRSEIGREAAIYFRSLGIIFGNEWVMAAYVEKDLRTIENLIINGANLSNHFIYKGLTNSLLFHMINNDLEPMFFKQVAFCLIGNGSLIERLFVKKIRCWKIKALGERVFELSNEKIETIFRNAPQDRPNKYLVKEIFGDEIYREIYEYES